MRRYETLSKELVIGHDYEFTMSPNERKIAGTLLQYANGWFLILCYKDRYLINALYVISIQYRLDTKKEAEA